MEYNDYINKFFKKPGVECTNEVYTLNLGTDLAQTFALRNGVIWRATASSISARNYTYSYKQVH